MIRQLDADAIKSLDVGDPLSVPKEFADLLRAALPDSVTRTNNSDSKDDTILLNREESFLLRWEAISHLNAMEVVAQSWNRDVAHRETIEEEMRFLLEKELGKTILTTVGKLASEEEYPGLFKLVPKLEANRNEELKRKKEAEEKAKKEAAKSHIPDAPVGP